MKIKELTAAALALSMLLMTACGDEDTDDSKSAKSKDTSSVSSVEADEGGEESTSDESSESEAETQNSNSIAFSDIYKAIGEFVSTNGTTNFDVEGFSALLVDKLGLTVERTTYDIDAVYDFSSDPQIGRASCRERV